MKSELPKIEERKCSEIYKLMEEFIPHYTPEWAASDENDPGIALLKIFSHITENVVYRLNQAPQKNFIAFLDMLGIKRLPAQPSRAPLTFMLAKGLEKDILIPERTQVAAKIKTNGQEEVPFETEKNLRAISSELKKVVAFYPAKDAIYVTPQGFLNLEQKRNMPGNYRTITSSLMSTKHIQLYYADGLEKGDFLKIGKDNVCEYKEISKKDNNVLEVTELFKSDFPVDTPVEKVTRFSLIEGKDMQEHCVYIGHKDFFNVKSTLTFTVYITHHRGSEAGNMPLDVSWEYWGEVKSEDGGGKGVDWHKFAIVSDSTDELTRSGVITLSKTTEGEIKEKEVNHIKNRWIRCRLNENFTNDKTWKLPDLDNIQFQVSSGKEPDLDPDLAFYNDTQLEIPKTCLSTQSFKPFGKEPKLLDTFAIASNEIFSKKGAQIRIDVKVEQRGVLAAPTAVSFYEKITVSMPSGLAYMDKEKIRIFAVGTDGRLVEAIIDPDGIDEIWNDHGFLANTEIDRDSIPSAVTNSSMMSTPISKFKFISIFARAKNSHLIELFYNSVQWKWIDQGTPEKVDIVFDPSAVYGEITVFEGSRSISVFVTGSDGSLYEFNRTPENMVGSWSAHGKPDNNISIASPPYAQSYSSAQNDIRAKVFVNGNDGRLYELDCKLGDKRTDKWTNYNAPKRSIKLKLRPFAVIYPEYNPLLEYDVYYAKIFVKGDDGNLWKFNTRNRLTKWVNLKKPSVSIQSAPHGHLINSNCEDKSFEGKHIFIRGSDNNLWELRSVNKMGNYINEWRTHGSAGKSKLLFPPYLILDNKNKEHVFSVSDLHSIIEKRIDLNTAADIWNEYYDQNENPLVPALSWEYSNKKGWLLLRLTKDETKNLIRSGSIEFDLPEEIEETEFAGQKNYWIRTRIVNGDYGKATFTVAENTLVLDLESKTIIEQKMISSKESIRPPIIKCLKIGYTLGGKKYPEKCLTYNNLDWLDQTEVSKIPDKFFKPFVQMDEKALTIYLGFQNYFKEGPVGIFFAARELQIDEETRPKLEWTYSIDNGWNELKGYSDGTEGLIKPDILELIGPLDFQRRSLFGEGLYWIRGSLIKGNYKNGSYPLLEGIFPNTTWALQAATVKDVIIGSSNGYPDQVFSIQKTPVLEKQAIRIREILSEEETQDMVKDSGKIAIEEKKDEKGKVIETWILWKEVPDFFNSDAKSRHYILDRATGQVQFGDGTNGMIPPKGDNNIKVFYQTGGGAKGNVSEGEIKSLKTSVPGVEKVLNFVAADGGSNAAAIEQMLEIGPAMISHRTRAITTEDFEWLAKKASRKVLKARCLPNTGKTSMNEQGRVAVIIVPDEKTEKPTPSLELKRKVQTYLEEHCANIIASNVFVDGPSYVEISISVDICVISIDVASRVESNVKKKLDDFLHPLTGGTEGNGWDFGRNVSDSDIYALLENIDDVDHIENLEITTIAESKEKVPWKSGIFLVSNGKHTINTRLIKESELYGST
ncbi:MAG TPA: putative baseplate assembly protein [Candidatus Methanoperedens sp.]